jgi:hypothetical protein
MSNKQKRLILIPTAWLGNRIRSISAAHAFAKHKERDLTVLWVNFDNGMVMPFSKIFEKPEGFKVVEFRNKFSWFIFQCLSKFFIFLKIKQLSNILILFGIKKIETHINEDPQVFIMRTDARFYPFEKIPLKFCNSICNEGEQFIASINGNYIGMHIRRGDNITATKNSPTELFLDAAKEEIFTNHKKIFLCSDDENIKNTFKEKFGNDVFTRDVVMKHSSERQLIDAAIDMYCLSKAEKIYGTYFSSFSTIASEFNNVPLVRLKVNAD